MTGLKPSTDMNAVDMAKDKCWRIFFAISEDSACNIHWQELLRGGWEASFSVPSGALTAYVSRTGYYEVRVSKGYHHPPIVTLAEGSFEDPKQPDSYGATPKTDQPNE